jgi:hypothetical protein
VGFPIKFCYIGPNTLKTFKFRLWMTSIIMITKFFFRCQNYLCTNDNQVGSLHSHRKLVGWMRNSFPWFVLERKCLKFNIEESEKIVKVHREENVKVHREENRRVIEQFRISIQHSIYRRNNWIWCFEFITQFYPILYFGR